MTPAQVLSAGDTIGTVGNTGNARTTPAHLHFGIYVLGEGPIDPFPFVAEPSAPAPPDAAARERVGSWGPVARRDTPVRSGMSSGSPMSGTLSTGTQVRLLGAAGRFQRVSPPTGEAGYVDADTATLAPAPKPTFERERISPVESPS